MHKLKRSTFPLNFKPYLKRVNKIHNYSKRFSEKKYHIPIVNSL